MSFISASDSGFRPHGDRSSSARRAVQQGVARVLEALEARVLMKRPAGLPVVVDAPAGAVVSADAVHESAAELVVIDHALAEQGLSPNDRPGLRTLVLDTNADAIDQITAALRQTPRVKAIHIVSHGSAGQIELGRSTINARTLKARAEALKEWSAALTDDAVIALYGCDVASDGNGRAFVQALAQRTGATVAASTDLTGSEALGGDWTLEYVVGDADSPVAPALPLATVLFDGVLSTVTVSVTPGETPHIVGYGASVVNATLSITTTDPGATYTQAVVRIDSGYVAGQDVLALPGAPAGFSASFNAGNGTLTVSAPGGKTAAQFESALRLVTYENSQGSIADISPRGIVFELGAASSSAKTVQPDLPVDAAMRKRILDALAVIDAIGQKITQIGSTPGSADNRTMAMLDEAVNELLYPTADGVAAMTPQQIGNLLRLHATADAYFSANPTLTDLEGLGNALRAKLATLVPGKMPLIDVSAIFAKPVSADNRRVDITVKVAGAQGQDQDLILDTLQRDLNFSFSKPPKVTVGGGGEIEFTIAINLAGHVFGTDPNTITANRVGIHFEKLNALAGYAFGGLNDSAQIGALRVQVLGGYGVVGARLPVNLGGAGNTRTLNNWAADGADVAGFGAAVSSAEITLPLMASIGGSDLTTNNTRIVFSDADLFDATPVSYTTVDYERLAYFGGMTIEHIIQEVLKVGDLFATLGDSDMLGTPVPFLDDVTLGQLADLKSLFDAAIGSQVNLYQPVLNSAGRMELRDARYPISDDGKASMYSDLKSGYTFGVIINRAGPVHTVTVPADPARQTLDDLADDLTAAFATAGLAITVTNRKDRLTFAADRDSIFDFALVPVAADEARLNPTLPLALGSLALNTPYYFTVTGSTAGSVTGTNYYTLASDLATAAVHAGILEDGQTGVVKVTRVGPMGSLIGSQRNGVTSNAAGAVGDAFLIESAASDLQKLGVVAIDEPMRVLEYSNNGAITATIALSADLSAAASIVVVSDANDRYTVDVPDNGRTDLADTLADIQQALLDAGITADTLAARLVDANGDPITCEPVEGQAYLQFYLPEGSAWDDFTLEPVSDETADRVLPLGFLTGDVAAATRPETLRTFQDLVNPALFPNLQITPIYDSVAQTVTLQFQVSGIVTPEQKAAFNQTFAKLGQIQLDDANLKFMPIVSSTISFELQFQVGPGKPITIASGMDVPADGRLSGDAEFDLDFVLQDTFSITLPQAWTSGNATVQDLVGDLNRALKQATDGNGNPVDLTDRLIARRLFDGTQIELTTATPVGGGVAMPISHTNGVLDGDLLLAFSHNGKSYLLGLSAESTADNTSFADLLLDLNDALLQAIVDTNGDGTIDADEAIASLNDLFFTTISDSGGNATDAVYLFATSPAGSNWPSAINLSADPANPAVTELGFGNSSATDLSIVTARAPMAEAKLLPHRDGSAFATTQVQLTLPSFSGSVQYGFNTINFTDAAGGIDAMATFRIRAGATPTVNEAATALPLYIQRAFTDVSGDDAPKALLTLLGLSDAAGNALIDDNASIEVSIPDITYTTVTVPKAIGVPIPVPGHIDGVLAEDGVINFLHDGARYTLTVAAADTADNTSFADLVADFSDALATATKTENGVATTVDLSQTFTVTESDGLVQVNELTATANPNYATVSLKPNSAAFGDIGLQGSFGLPIVAQALEQVLPVLDGLQADLPQFSQFKLPLIDTPVNALIDVKGDLLSRISKLKEMTVSSSSQLASSVAAALGVPNSYVQVNFDSANNAYRIDLQYETGTADAKPLQMTLADFYRFTNQQMPEAFSEFRDTAAKTPLLVKVRAITTLSLGIDLSDPEAPRAFLYGHDGSNDRVVSDGSANGTSIEVQIEAQANDINFTVAAGASGIYVRGGNATLGGPVRKVGGETVYTFNAKTRQLHLARESDAASLIATLGAAGQKYYLQPNANELDATNANNYNLAFSGSAEANLPLYTPDEFTDPFHVDRTMNVRIDGVGKIDVNPRANLFELRIADLDAYADAAITVNRVRSQVGQIYLNAGAPLDGAQQSQVDALQAQVEALKSANVLSLTMPDIDQVVPEQSSTGLFDMMRDPSKLIDGLDTALGAMESGLKTLDNIKLPIIGPTLGKAVKGVMGWRQGWLTDLKQELRGRDAAVFEALKKEIYNFLGPSGINLLLKDNGIRSVDGMMTADSPDDVTLNFLDRDGNKIEGNAAYGAEAFEFRVRLGQQLVNTGVNLDFDFSALEPVLSLGIKGGLTFKLGWDMTIGFGIHRTEGFYIVTDSAEGANELELRFEAGLNGEQTGFTVAPRAGSLTGYSIKDANGNWVYGPPKGDGSRDILDVMAVNEDGTNFTDGTPPTPDECEAEVAAGGTQRAYWVVALPNGNGVATPAYIDALGQFRPQSGNDWKKVNNNVDARNPDKMVQYNQTAPFLAYGSLFMFKLTAIDQVHVGLKPAGDGDYFYDPKRASTITSYGRNDPQYGVNRNNHLQTRIAGRIAVNLKDPSSGADDYVARPGPTATGFMIYDGSNGLGGNPVLDRYGNFIPVHQVNGKWMVMGPANPADLDSPLIPLYEMKKDLSPNRITMQELSESGLKVFEFKVNAEAVVNLKLELSISENANIPKITAEFNLDWRSDSVKPPENPFAADDGEDELDLVPEVGINNIRLDLGSFLTKFIKPIADKIDDAMKPLDPLIDVLKTKIPVISSIAGRNIRLVDLLAQFGGGHGKAAATLIDIVTLVRELSGVMANVPADTNVYLPIGNFWLAKVSAGPLGKPGLGKQIYYDNNEISAPSFTQRNQSLIADADKGLNAAVDALGALDKLDRSSSSQPGVAKADRGGFDLPILSNPLTIFKLLMGETVPLVTFSLPKLDFNVEASLPLIKIVVLEVGLRIGMQMKARLAMGYDTHGLMLFKESKSVVDLLDGFYISDRANADGTGADVDEFAFKAKLALYGEINLVLAKAGIEGGFEFTANINLNDPNNDGKIRVMEAAELVAHTGNPLDLADITLGGEVYAKYYWWTGIKIFGATITLARGGDTFARAKVFQLKREGRDGPPVLASKVTSVDQDGNEQAGTLMVHIGPNSSKRISNEDPLKLKDGAERVKVWNDADGSGTVHVRYDNYSTSYTKTFTGVARLLIDGGEGNDVIDLSGLRGLPVEVRGGGGNDVITLGSGSASVESTISGGAGNDQIIINGGGKVRIYGDEGDDVIVAGAGANIIDPGAGNDTVTGGGAGSTNTVRQSRQFGIDDILFNPTALTNLLDYAESTLPITANLGGAGSKVTAGDTNSTTFDFSAVTEIRGTDGRDVFNVTDPSTRQANGGKGVILRGGPSNDTYNVTANDLTQLSTDGITIDDTVPYTKAVVGTVKFDNTCGKIKQITIASPGSGYSEAPEVRITDPTGYGARAVASIDDEGRVTGIYILSEGRDYTNPTVELIQRISTGDQLNFSSNISGTFSLDRAGNGGDDVEIRKGNRAIKFTGYTTPGVVRPKDYEVNEIDGLTVKVPNGTIHVQDAVDFIDQLSIEAKRLVQDAAITADLVRITTDRGFAADHPINATGNGDVLIRVTGKVDPDAVGVTATAEAVVVDGVITAINVTNPGANYTFTPTVYIVDARGAGARAVAQMSDGQITGITVLDGGYGYLASPAPKVVIAHPDSIQLNDHLSTSTVGSEPGTGDGRGTVTLRAEAGAINQTGDVLFPAGSNIEWQHGDYRYKSVNTLEEITPLTYPATAGGHGAKAEAVLDDDGRVVAINVIDGGEGYSRELLPTVQIEGSATATAIVGYDGKIAGFKITYPGEGYGRVPVVTILPNGFGKIVGEDAEATRLNRVHIKSAGGSLVATAYTGIGDAQKPLKTDVQNMVAQTYGAESAIYVLEKDSVRIGHQDNINGLNTIDGNIGVTTFNGVISLGQPVQQTNAAGELLWQDAEKTIPIYARDENGKIIYKGGQLASGKGEIKLTADDVDVNNFVSATGGKLVMQPVNPSAPIGLNGTRARATAVVENGLIARFDTFWSGRGYTKTPLVTVAPPGERAVGVASVLNGQVTGINVTFGGTRYSADHPPIITLKGGGLNGAEPARPAVAQAVFNADGVVTGVTILDGGAGYYEAPKVEFSLPGKQAKVQAVVAADGRIAELQIIDPGSNYAEGTSPNVHIQAPYEFSLEGEEIAYFQEGFDDIIIGRNDGRHTFHSADAAFVDGVTLRSPLGGQVQMENLLVADGPAVIIGSGHTLNMTTESPFVTGTFVEVDDNIVVHDGTDAVITATTGYVSIFGSGKGKIDGVAGSTSENLTINDVGNVVVTGAIGSTYPINNLTINSSAAGAINLQQSVRIEGDLHIVKGGNITFGGNLTIGGNLIIDEGAVVSFAGTVTVDGNLIIRKATSVSFAQNVRVKGDYAVGNENNPTLVGSVTFAGSATLDVDGNVALHASGDMALGALSLDGYLMISRAQSLAFNGLVTIAGSFIIRQATTVSFAKNVNVGGNVLFGNAMDPTKLEGVSFASTARFDAAGTVSIYVRDDIVFGNRVGATVQPTVMALRSESRDVSFAEAVNLPAGKLVIYKARDVTFGQEVTVNVLLIAHATGQTRFQRYSAIGMLDVTSTALVQVMNRLDITSGSATITTDEVDFAGGSASVSYTGNGQSTLTIRPRTFSRAITVGSPPGAVAALDISDVDLAAISPTFSELAIGNSDLGTGTVIIGSVGSQQGSGNSRFVTNTRIHGGSIHVVQPIDSAKLDGFLKLVARTGDVVIDAAVNSTGVERSKDLEIQSLAGSIVLNQPVWAGAEMRLIASGEVKTAGDGFINAPKVRVSAGGAVTLMHASNSVGILAIEATNSPIQFRHETSYKIGAVDGVNGLNAGAGNIKLLTHNGTIAQTQPIVAGGLELLGTSGVFDLGLATNNVATLAADGKSLNYRDANALAIGGVGTTRGLTIRGDAVVVSGGNMSVTEAITATGNVTLDARTAAISFADAGVVNTSGAFLATADSGITTAADVTAAGNIGFASPVTLADNITLSAGDAGSIGFAQSIDGAYALALSAGRDVHLAGNIGQTTPLTAISITKARNVTLDGTGTVGQFTSTAAANSAINGSLAATGAKGVVINSTEITVNGAIGTKQGPITLAADLRKGSVLLTNTGRLWATGPLTITSAAFNMAAKAKIGVSTTDDVTIVADTMTIYSRADAIAGYGRLLLQPISPTRQIDIGAVGGAFDLTQGEINAIAPTFRQVVIGRGNGNGLIKIDAASFRSAVLVQAPASNGVIAVTGEINTVSRAGHIDLNAGRELAIAGTVAAKQTGTVRLTADVDGDGRGFVSVGMSGKGAVATANGDIIITGPIVQAGSARAAANIISANSSVVLGANANGGSVTVANAATQVRGEDILIGGLKGAAHPAAVNLQGNLRANDDINIHGSGDVRISSFRFHAGDVLNVNADRDVVASDGILIAQGTGARLRADADRNRDGKARVSNVEVSQPSALNLSPTLGKVDLKTRLAPGAHGTAAVGLTNLGRGTATGKAKVRVYATFDSQLDASDVIVGYADVDLNIKPGRSATVPVKLRLPELMPKGTYSLVAEVIPYAAGTNGQTNVSALSETRYRVA